MLNQLLINKSVLIWTIYAYLGAGSIMVPEKNFLEDSKVSPSKLEYFRDSVEFEIKGTVPIESMMVPRNPQVKLVFRSAEETRELGNLELKKRVAEYTYQKKFKLAYEPWMEGAILEAHFYQGKKKPAAPSQKKVLARGVITTPLLAKVGTVSPDEPIPQIGLYIPTGAMDVDMSRSEELSFLFEPGSSVVKLTNANKKALDKLREFITENPSILSLRITGTQSPEAAEGKSSKLGMDRAKAVQKLIATSDVFLRDSITEVKSRWNDWFDFRLILRDYEKLSTQRKDQYYAILLNGADYDLQAREIRKVPGFEQVSRELFPKLRSVRVEVVAKPLPGLNQPQLARLTKVLEEGVVDSELDLTDWSVAGEAAPRLDDKLKIYSKMTELYRSALPYNNLAVVKMRQAQRTLDNNQRKKLWSEADRLLNQALKIEKNPYVLHNKGQLLILLDKPWEAYKMLSDASVLTKNTEFLKYNESLRGALDILRGDFKLATLRFDYTYSEPKDFFNKGLAHFLAKDYGNASISFEESVYAGRNYGYGYYGLALIAAVSGQEELALIQLEKAIQASELIYQKALIDPVFEEIRETDAFFGIFRSLKPGT